MEDDNEDTQVNLRLILSDTEAQVLLSMIEHSSLPHGARVIANEVGARIEAMIRTSSRQVLP